MLYLPNQLDLSATFHFIIFKVEKKFNIFLKFLLIIQYSSETTIQLPSILVLRILLKQN